jgi:2-polyprenyl-6-methoxyphenol hydroxylase-like FAD-dependent oxidoreductase
MHTEVLIVGAGPSGLVLANVLAGQGVGFTIVDKKPGPVRQSRAAIIHVRTLELLDRLGLAAPAIARGVKTTRVEVYERGRPAAGFPLAGRGSEALTPFPYALGLEQDRTEQLLVEGLAEHGRGVEWNTELRALVDGDDGATAVVRRADGTEDTISSRWVVGADGASSPVRHAAGLGFVGKTYAQTGLLADVELDAPTRATLAAGTIRLNLTRGGFVGMASLSRGLHRLFGAVPPELAPGSSSSEVSHEAYAQASAEDIQRWLDEYFFVRARLERVEWTALYRVHSRIAERFRAGNVFLVGDAAHIHSPAGGQGMNLGIGDAFNLGWKLALVANGHADERLLDSYPAERHPVATSVLRGADRGFALEATTHPLAQWARANLATRLVGPLLRLPAVRSMIFRLFSQTWITYPASPAVTRQRRPRAGPRPGDRAPYGVLESAGRTGPQTLFDLIGGTVHHLLLFQGSDPDPATNADRHAIHRLLDRYRLEIHVHVVPSAERALHRRYGVTRARVFLIRPDGHIAYTGSPHDLDGLAAYLDRLYARGRSATAET